jgi:hypothetical protein
MDDTDRAVRDELDRRLAVLAVEHREAPQPPFPRADLIALVAVVVVSMVLGLIVGLG